MDLLGPGKCRALLFALTGRLGWVEASTTQGPYRGPENEQQKSKGPARSAPGLCMYSYFAYLIRTQQ
jgi:hypothetical protein